MLTTALIAFREFFEAFLIVGVFLGLSKTLNLKKGKEIALAAFVGASLSLVLSVVTYMLGSRAGNILTEERAEFLEGYLMVFSGIFIAYVVFSLHDLLNRRRGETIDEAKKHFSEGVFDLSLFFMITFLVLREGFEVALFTASVSLFSAFLENFYGLIMGFVAAATLGIATFFAYSKLPIRKVFKITEYAIVLLGASLTQRGITELLESHYDFHLSELIPLPVAFLPSDESVFGHALKTVFGIDQEFSLARLSIMIAYIGIIYFVFIRYRNQKQKTRTTS